MAGWAQEGETGIDAQIDALFVVDSGALEMSEGGVRLRELKPGDTFGEAAVFDANPAARQHSVRTLATPSPCLGILPPRLRCALNNPALSIMGLDGSDCSHSCRPCD